MTDNDKQTEGQEPTTGQEPTGTPETTEQPKTFSADYVAELRQEAAKYRTRAKELESLKQKQTDADKAAELERLEKQNEWQKLAEARQAEIDTVKALVAERDKMIQDNAIKSAIIAEAAKQSAVSGDAVYRLLDMSQVDIDDAGNVTGVETAVTTLLKDSPYLVATKSPNGVPKTPVPQGKGDISDAERRQRSARTF
ncbi:MAG: hypothetical protein GY938_12790 [Ketobacter sp.]|nr:hypothetical protein [Ketobacter sp.]